MTGELPLVLHKNKNRHVSGRGTATSTDDQEDIFQNRQQRQQTSTSRSLSTPMTTPNGFLDSCISIEHFPAPPPVHKNNGDRQYPVTLHGLAESSGRDSDEDEEDEDEECEEVEMVDHACQTRESLFDNSNADALGSPDLQSQVTRGSVIIQPRVQMPLPSDKSRYKAERTIDIAQRSPQPLPTMSPGSRTISSKATSSAGSSKSGADVVVLH